MSWTLKELELAAARCQEDEYQMFLSVIPRNDEVFISVTLEKGSSYGKMHMQFKAEGKTVTEAFEKCLVNFPRNPVGAIWDSQRLAPPSTDATFTEVE